MKNNILERTKALTHRMDLTCLGVDFYIIVERDMINPENGRVFIQLSYESPCSKTNKKEIWKGRKWYLSEYMTDDEIVKTVYSAFEMAVKHEILEGFQMDGKILFNPHINFEELLKISHLEVKRIHIPSYNIGDFE